MLILVICQETLLLNIELRKGVIVPLIVNSILHLISFFQIKIKFDAL